MTAHEHRRGLFAVLFAALLWSSGGLFIKWVTVDAFVITQWRSLWAAITIGLLARARFAVIWRRPALGFALVASYALTLLTFVMATRLTTAANAIFLQYTAPLWVATVGFLFLREPPSRLDLVTLVFAFGGMVLFFVGRLEPTSARGNLVALSSGVFFATFLLLLRRGDSALRIAAMTGGNVVLFLSMVILHWAQGDLAAFHPSWRDQAALVFLGVVQIGVAYVIFDYGIARVPALEASLLAMLEPVLNPLWVWLVLRERPSFWANLGGAVILGALAARSILADRREARALAERSAR